MSEVLESGYRITTLFKETVIVKEFIAEGGQGSVYKVEYRGEEKALKWYKKRQLWQRP